MTQKKQRLTLLIVGGVLIAGAAAMAVTTRCPSDMLQLVVRIMLALAAGCIGAMIPGTLGYEQGFLKASGGVAFVILVYMINPPIMQSGSCNELKGTLVIDGNVMAGDTITILESNQLPVITSQNGRFLFVNVGRPNPPELRFKVNARMRTKNLVRIDTLLTFGYDSVINRSLTVSLNSQTNNKLAGRVYTADGNPLAGVKIIADSTEVLSDETGYFSLWVKTTDRKVMVKFLKNGFRPFSKSIELPDEDISVGMQRI